MALEQKVGALLVTDLENRRKIDNFVRLNPLKVRFKTPKESLDYFPRGWWLSKPLKCATVEMEIESTAVVNDYFL